MKRLVGVVVICLAAGTSLLVNGCGEAPVTPAPASTPKPNQSEATNVETSPEIESEAPSGSVSLEEQGRLYVERLSPEQKLSFRQWSSLYQGGTTWVVQKRGERIETRVCALIDHGGLGQSAGIIHELDLRKRIEDWSGVVPMIPSPDEWVRFDPAWHYSGEVVETGTDTLQVGTEEWECVWRVHDIDGHKHKLWTTERFGEWLPPRLDIDGKTVLRVLNFSRPQTFELPQDDSEPDKDD